MSAQKAEKGKKKAKPHGAPFRDNIEVIVFAIIMALGLKVFALEAYQIPTGSMQPNLMGTYLLDESGHGRKGGIYDRVLVDKLSFLLRDPERWEVVVFRYPLVAHNNYVKRLVGLSGEQLLVEYGDVRTRPLGDSEAEFKIARKPDGVQDSLWRPVWPSPIDDLEAWSAWALTGSFSRDGQARTLRGRGGFELGGRVRADYVHGYAAAIYDRVPANVPGASRRDEVGDLRLQAEVQPGADAAPLEIGLRRNRDYQVRLQLDPAAGKASLELPDGTSWESPLAMPAGTTVEIDLAHWDEHVRLRLTAGGTRLVHEADLDVSRREILNNGVWFESEGGEWNFPTQPRVARDIHYLPALNHGPTIYDVPEGFYFMMGDNTQNSLDSRDWEARELDLDPPVDGHSKLRGDQLRNGSDPFFDNPRWNAAGDQMTFRDEFGELHIVDPESIQDDQRVPAPLVPRSHILGKALAVFLPVPPFSPVVRIKTVR